MIQIGIVPTLGYIEARGASITVCAAIFRAAPAEVFHHNRWYGGIPTEVNIATLQGSLQVLRGIKRFTEVDIQSGGAVCADHRIQSLLIIPVFTYTQRIAADIDPAKGIAAIISAQTCSACNHHFSLGDRYSACSHYTFQIALIDGIKAEDCLLHLREVIGIGTEVIEVKIAISATAPSPIAMKMGVALIAVDDPGMCAVG